LFPALPTKLLSKAETKQNKKLLSNRALTYKTRLQSSASIRSKKSTVFWVNIAVNEHWTRSEARR